MNLLLLTIYMVKNFLTEKSFNSLILFWERIKMGEEINTHGVHKTKINYILSSFVLYFFFSKKI